MEINNRNISIQTTNEDSKINQNSNLYKNIFFINTIKKEIKMEKRWLIWTILISILILIITSTLMSIGLAIFLEKLDKKTLPSNIFFYWFTQLFLTVILLWILTGSFLSFYKIKQEEKIYYSNEDYINFERTPIFIKNSYKRRIALKIFLNWFSIISYIFIGLFLTLSILFQIEKINFFNFAKIKIELDEVSKNNIKTSIIITSIYITIVFICHLLSYILLTMKNTQLSLIFELEKKLDKEEIRIFKKKVNIVCGTIFLLPIIIFILIWFIRKKKKTN